MTGVSIALTSPYVESGTYNSYLGWLVTNTVTFTVYIWYFAYSPSTVAPATFMSGVVSSGCLTSGCTGTCIPSTIDPILGATGCLPLVTSNVVTSDNENCPYACTHNYMYGTGCVGSGTGMVCLVCSCDFLSCNMSESLTAQCICPAGSVASSNTCTCPSGQYYDGIKCLLCNSDCLTCNSATLCISCVSSNSSPGSNIGCVCNYGYYNLTSLNTRSSCIAVSSECLSWDGYGS